MLHFGHLFVAGGFLTMAIMVPIWFVQISKLFKYLDAHHPNEYDAMGKPTLFLNNTPKNNIAFLRFILGSRNTDLDDAHLSKWCHRLKIFFYIYLSVFFSVIIIGFSFGNANS